MPGAPRNLDSLSGPPYGSFADRARRSASREWSLEAGAMVRARTEDELERGFAAALACVALTGDAYDDRVALTRAARAHANTVVGWDRDYLDDCAERAIEDALRTPTTAACLPIVAREAAP